MNILQNNIVLIFLWLVVSQSVMSQVATAEMGDHVATGSQVVVPVEVTGFNDVGAISMFIDYDESVVSFDTWQNPALSGMMVSNNNGQIGISWMNTSPGNNVNGTLLELVFNYYSGTTPLDFLEGQCEVTDYELNPLSVVYTDGSVTGDGQATVSLTDQLNQIPNSLVSFPLNVDFSEPANGVGAFQFTIEFDDSILEYNGLSNEQVTGINVNMVSNPTALIISWSDASNPTNLNGTLLDIDFSYTGGDGNLTFDVGTSSVSDYEMNELFVEYENAQITQGTGGGQASVAMVDQLNQTPNSQVSVPLTVDFSDPANGVGSFQFVIEFDENVLNFDHLSNEQVSGITTNVVSNPTALEIIWSGAANPTSLNGTLLDIVFNYTNGSSDLIFDGTASSVSDNHLVELSVEYTDAQVTQDPATALTLSLGSLEIPAGSEAEVPLTVEQFTNVGSFELHIDHDSQVVDFIEIRNIHSTLNGSGINVNDNNGTVMINYIHNEPLTISDGEKLFDIVYNFQSGSSQLVFDETISEVSDWFNNPFNVVYNDGELNESAGFEATTSADTVSGQPGLSVNVPLRVEKYDNIGAITYQVRFDKSVMTFNQLSNVLPELSNNGLLEANATGDVLDIIWKVDGVSGTGLNIPDGKLFDMTFNYTYGSSKVEFVIEKCDVVTYEHQQVQVSYSDGQVSNQTGLSVKCFLEGLYNSSSGQMNKAKDYVDGAIVDKYSGTVADLIDIELHDATSYGTVIFSEENVELNQDGTASVSIPSQYDGQYYITIKHRNHIETVSAMAVDFTSGVIDYDFTTATSQAYGSNLAEINTGVYGVYGGDVNQDGFIDGLDLTPLILGFRMGNNGYDNEDINGDGFTDGLDLTIVILNFRAGQESILPDL